MADRAPAPDTPELRERWGSFAWTTENAAKAKEAQIAAEGLPKLSLTSRYGRNNQPVSSGFGANSFPAQGREFYIGVQLQIPLFEGFSRNYQIREAAAERQRQGEALAEVRRDAPDVLVADYHLHDELDGLEALVALREVCGAHTPAVLVTADGSDALKRAARDQGIPVLTKPVKPASLRAFLAAQQRRVLA